MSEAERLSDGTAVLRLPGGLRWVAAHEGYDPPRRFVDRQVSLPLHWVHTHRFEELGPTTTRVIDEVDTPVPARLLRPLFAYRHRQLAEDLAAHRALGSAESPMTVGVTGASGLVGRSWCAFLSTGGHRVVRLVRRAAASPDERSWDPGAPDPDAFAGLDAVVHLAGASIAGRFDETHRRAIRDSRVGPTRRLARAVARAPDGPRVLVCASAVGFYGPGRGDEELTEQSGRGGGFLASVVDDWEGALAEAADAGVRTVRVRTGIVQSAGGGALALQRPVFTVGLGGHLGSGRQWTAWVDIDDLCDVYARALLDQRCEGPLNAVSPHPVRNAEYAQTLARVLRRPARLGVPPRAVEVLFGREGAREVVLAGQRALPPVLLGLGHHFRRPRLEDCLRHQLGRPEADPATLSPA
jgi:uncharacterized protein (TIGR01777 family)